MQKPESQRPDAQNEEPVVLRKKKTYHKPEIVQYGKLPKLNIQREGYAPSSEKAVETPQNG